MLNYGLRHLWLLVTTFSVLSPSCVISDDLLAFFRLLALLVTTYYFYLTPSSGIRQQPEVTWRALDPSSPSRDNDLGHKRVDFFLRLTAAAGFKTARF